MYFTKLKEEPDRLFFFASCRIKLIRGGDVMAYQMQYGDNQIKYSIPRTRKKIKIKTLCILVVVVIVIGLLFIPEARQLFIPGDAAVTKAAANEMITRIRDGEGVREAFAQFCLDVIQNS